MRTNSLAMSGVLVSDELRRKRLGQYFSGSRVAHLLVALAARPDIQTVIDPMAGSGDMLFAADAVFPQACRLDGIEIDPLAQTACAELIARCSAESANCVLGNAFDAKNLASLDPAGYDLVVTNPPYVRYQALKHSNSIDGTMPNALEVRNGLRNCLKNLESLDAADRELFLALADGYSGLSDLAVPAWILCAALVKPGGTLAMVVPDAWLNRDYAVIVQYLLLRWFRIEFVVEDAHAAWFPDALVKTTLLVARRIPRLPSIQQWQDEYYLRIALPSTLATTGSLVAGAFRHGHRQPEQAFAGLAHALLQDEATAFDESIHCLKVRFADHSSSVRVAAHKAAWLRSVEPDLCATVSGSLMIPVTLAALLPGASRFTSLADLGVSVGQGLRTGANDFFYVELVSTNNNLARVRLSHLFGEREIEVPLSCLIPAVRRQKDVPETTSSSSTVQLRFRVLDLRQFALPEEASCLYEPMPDSLAAHVRSAATTSADPDTPARLLPHLSAVASNVRKGDPKKGVAPRYWYMLPQFAPRHRPDLFMARVNSGTPRIHCNHGREALIDANFITLWRDTASGVSIDTLFAYLSSTLAAAFFEYSGSVMGGGALKLESTHLSKLPVPRFSADANSALARLGRSLLSGRSRNPHQVREAIDQVVCRELFGASRTKTWLTALKAAIERRQADRHHRL